jgi:filamentous hemagglutinin family protein
MNRLYLFTLLFLYPFFSIGQDAAAGKSLETRPGTEEMILSGVQFNNFSGLNGQLKAAGLAPLNAGMFSLGGGAAIRFRQLIIGADLTWLGGTQEAVYANGLSNTLYVSTNALASGKWIFSPIVGIGSQDIHVRINQPGTATSFVNALTGSYNQVELDHETIFLDLGMAFKIRWPGGRKNYIPIFKAGYRYGLEEDNAWSVRNNSAVADGPRDRVSSFYLNLLVAFVQ